MTKIDCHCHTKYSKCSNLEPEQILKICRKKGIDGIILCDHDTTKGVKAFKKILSSQDDFILIPGIEIFTNKGEILAAWIEEKPSTVIFPDVVDEIRGQGGFIILPHPYDKIRKKAFTPDDSVVPYLDAIEVFNSRCLMPRGNKKALKFAEKHSLIQTAGSDSHFSVEIGNAWLEGEFSNGEDFRNALQKGNTTVHGRLSPIRTHAYTALHRIRRDLKLYKVEN
ncbi:MAG: PHP-associated domain-containing protein [Candidatus Hodarchaeales archaeon]